MRLNSQQMTFVVESLAFYSDEQEMGGWNLGEQAECIVERGWFRRVMGKYRVGTGGC